MDKKKTVVHIKDFLKTHSCDSGCILILQDTMYAIDENLKELQAKPEWRDLSCPHKIKCLQAIFLHFTKSAKQYA